MVMSNGLVCLSLRLKDNPKAGVGRPEVGLDLQSTGELRNSIVDLPLR